MKRELLNKEEFEKFISHLERMNLKWETYIRENDYRIDQDSLNLIIETIAINKLSISLGYQVLKEKDAKKFTQKASLYTDIFLKVISILEKITNLIS